MKNILKMLDDMAERLYDEINHYKVLYEAYKHERDELKVAVDDLRRELDTANEANDRLTVNLDACQRGNAKLSDELAKRDEAEYQKSIERTLANDEPDGIPI